MTLAPVKNMSRKRDCWDNAVAESFTTIKRASRLTATTGAIAETPDAAQLGTRPVSPIEFEFDPESDEDVRMAPWSAVHRIGEFQSLSTSLPIGA